MCQFSVNDTESYQHLERELGVLHEHFGPNFFGTIFALGLFWNGLHEQKLGVGREGNYPNALYFGFHETEVRTVTHAVLKSHVTYASVDNQ